MFFFLKVALATQGILYRILVLRPGIEPGLLAVKVQSPTTGLPGNSLCLPFPDGPGSSPDVSQC